MEKIYRQVSVKDRLPEKDGFVTCFEEKGTMFITYFTGRLPSGATHWLEEYTLETIQDKRELTATFLVNSIRLLDEQGARHLVNELCERFHLLPSEDEILEYARDEEGLEDYDMDQDVFVDGANYILNTLKGEKSNG